jgi:hypothetical protein
MVVKGQTIPGGCKWQATTEEAQVSWHGLTPVEPALNQRPEIPRPRMDMVSSHGERVTALDYHCRTIVLNRGPFCLSTRLNELASAGAISFRADFLDHKYDPPEVRQRRRAVRAGRAIAGGHAANFDRGVQ